MTRTKVNKLFLYVWVPEEEMPETLEELIYLIRQEKAEIAETGYISDATDVPARLRGE